MQVPVVMTTSLGQKISTVAVQQPAGTTGAAGHAALLANSPAAGNTNSQQKVRRPVRCLAFSYKHTDLYKAFLFSCRL